MRELETIDLPWEPRLGIVEPALDAVGPVAEVAIDQPSRLGVVVPDLQREVADRTSHLAVEPVQSLSVEPEQGEDALDGVAGARLGGAHDLALELIETELEHADEERLLARKEVVEAAAEYAGLAQDRRHPGCVVPLLVEEPERGLEYAALGIAGRHGRPLGWLIDRSIQGFDRRRAGVSTPLREALQGARLESGGAPVVEAIAEGGGDETVTLEQFVWVAAGLAAGGVLGWLLAARRASGADAKAAAAEATSAELRRSYDDTRALAGEEVRQLRAALAAESEARVRAETERREIALRLEEEKRLLAEAKEKLTDTFKALAGTTLDSSTKAFLALANETFEKILAEARGDLGKRQEAITGLVKPLAESMQKFDEHVRGVEKERQEAYTGLKVHLEGLVVTHDKLQRETASLAGALKAPQVRGRWGEMTLRRAAELAGMSPHCDFAEQVDVATDEGRIRPDLVVRLPAGREIVVDAKVALDAYLEALEAESEEARGDALVRHAKQIRAHMDSLAGKGYWQQFESVPEFVVMFIPGEAFFAAALEADRALIEDGASKGVILATPTILISLLRAVASGWRQEQIAENARRISELGRDLYERMRVLADHLGKVGDGLERANKAFNSAAASLETRVLPAARRFKELGAATGEEIRRLEAIETQPRTQPVIEAEE